MGDRTDDAVGKAEVSQRLPDHGAARGKDPLIAEIRAVARHPSGLKLSEQRHRGRERLGGRRGREQHVIGLEDERVFGELVLMVAANRSDRNARGQP